MSRITYLMTFLCIRNVQHYHTKTLPKPQIGNSNSFIAYDKKRQLKVKKSFKLTDFKAQLERSVLKASPMCCLLSL